MDAVQLVYSKIQMLPMSQIQQVLDYIDSLPKNLKLKNTETKKIDEINPEVAKYAGMIKVKSTPEIEDLLNFDPASIATDTI